MTIVIEIVFELATLCYYVSVDYMRKQNDIAHVYHRKSFITWEPIKPLFELVMKICLNDVRT